MDTTHFQTSEIMGIWKKCTSPFPGVTSLGEAHGCTYLNLKEEKKKKKQKNKNREKKFDEWVDGSKGAFSLVYLSIWPFYFA